MTNNNVFATAYKFFTLGCCVLPSGGGESGKSPLVPWKPYQKTKPTDEQLQSWEAEFNPKLWGFVTGKISNRFTIDDDKPGDNSIMSKSGLKPHRKTPHEGLHYDCLWPDFDIPTKVGILPNIDVRGEGGFVNFAGRVGDKCYELLQPPTPENLILFPQLPQELQKALIPKRKTIAGRILQQALDRAHPGNRNDTGLWLACQLRDNGISQAEAESIMRQYVGDVSSTGLEPYTESEAIVTLNQAYMRPAREPWHSSLTNSESTTLDTPVSLELPAIVWQGLFKDYIDLVDQTTEAARAFHYATFCQVLGCTIGRRLHVYHATKLYPNFYICLVGKSGLTRKDTCWSRASDLLNRLHTQSDSDEYPLFRIVKGIRSYEGLLDELSGERKVRLIQLGELLSLLAKAKQESLGNIVPQLTELYDCPDCVNPPVRQKMVVCREPFVSIMAGTTQAWLKKALTERDIYGGFANRWLYFFGLPKEPKPNPPKVNPDKRDDLVREINQICLWAEDVPNGEVTISDEASAPFAEYYRGYYHHCQQEGLIPVLIVRIQDFIWKLALLYAAMDLSDVIKADHIKAAIAVGNYLEASVVEAFRSFADSRGKQSETKVLEYLKGKGQPADYRLVYSNLNMSAKELELSIQPLINLGLIKNSYRQNRMGQRVRTLEVS